MKCKKCGRESSGSQCPFCGYGTPSSEDVLNLPVLRAGAYKKRKKEKMIKFFIIAAVVLLIITAIAIAVKLGGRKAKNDTSNVIQTEATGDEMQQTKEPDTSPVSADEDISLSLEGFSSDYADAIGDYNSTAANMDAIKESTTSSLSSSGTTQKEQITPGQHLEATTVKSGTPANSSSAVLKVVNAFFTGTYYMDGDIIKDTEKQPLEMAMNGSDYQVFTEMDGNDISIMYLGGKLYLVSPNDKKYTEVNAAVKKLAGISDDMFSFEFNKVKFDAYSPSSVTAAEYNGKKAVCYTYEDKSTKLEFIAVNNEIKQMAMYDSDGKAETVLVTDEFSAEIPSEMFNFKGYSKTNIISFMTSFM